MLGPVITPHSLKELLGDPSSARQIFKAQKLLSCGTWEFQGLSLAPCPRGKLLHLLVHPYAQNGNGEVWGLSRGYSTDRGG